MVPEAEELDDAGWGELEAIAGASLQNRPPGLARRLRVLLGLIQWLPVMRHGRTFTALDPARRADVLRYLEDHRIQVFRVGFWGLRTLILLGFYGRGEAAAAIGYRADPRGWEAVRK